MIGEMGLEMKKIRIGGGQGFWGDSNDAAVHMIHEGNLDYMACDYLAELTLYAFQKNAVLHDYIVCRLWVNYIFNIPLRSVSETKFFLIRLSVTIFAFL